MLAGIAKTPELALEPAEADALADASVKVAELYDLTADPRTVAWGNLLMVAGMVYGTRIVAISARHKAERRARAASNVVPIRTADVGPQPAAEPTTTVSPDGKLPPFDGPGQTRQ